VAPIRCTAVPAAPNSMGIAGFALVSAALARVARRKKNGR